MCCADAIDIDTFHKLKYTISARECHFMTLTLMGGGEVASRAIHGQATLLQTAEITIN
jgi:hypothetical protein